MLSIIRTQARPSRIYFCSVSLVEKKSSAPFFLYERRKMDMDMQSFSKVSSLRIAEIEPRQVLTKVMQNNLLPRLQSAVRLAGGSSQVAESCMEISQRR